MRVQTYLSMAIERATIFRALRISLIVGTILVAINQGDKIVCGRVDSLCLISSGLTYLVPYCVSTISSVLARTDVQSAEDRIRWNQST